MEALLADGMLGGVTDTRLFRNNGNGSFSLMPLPPTQHTSYNFNSFWSDDDGDGRLDMLIIFSDEASRATLRLYHQRSDQSFLDTGVRLPGRPVVWTDLDNDGDLDILAGSTGAQANEWSIYWKQAGTNYTETKPGFEAVVPSFSGYSAAAAIDLDNDGDLDILARSWYNDPAHVFRNDGPNQFSDTGLTLSTRAASRNAWADVDGDGDLDFITAGRDLSGNTANIPVPKYFRNEGNLRFADANSEVTTIDSVQGGDLCWADFDQDGDADVLLNGALAGGTQFFDLRVRVFLNDGAGRYTDSAAQLVAFQGGEAEVLDFEGDGDVDFMVSGFDGSSQNSRRLYRNNRTASGTNRPAPINLSSEVAGNRVILHWNSPTGAAAGLTFNLRVGKQSGASDVISPAATSDGRQLVPAMGNAQMARRRHIVGLAPGTYYWSAQSVDQSYRGSSFAAEASFTVPETPTPLPPPTISELPHQFTDEDVPPPSVNFTIGPASSLPNLSFAVEASNLQVCPASGILIVGEGTNRTLSITPGTNQSGTSLITVRVTDAAGQSASSSFLLSVNPVNDPPLLDPIASQFTYENSPLNVSFRATDVETQIFELSITATSSNPTLIASNGLRVVASSDLEVTPQTNRTGSAVVTLTVSDGHTEASAAFVVTVLPQPFVPTADHLTNLNSGAVGCADLNGDGAMDLLLTGSSEAFRPGTIRYYRNRGDGSLIETDLSRDGWYRTVSSLVDYDRDDDVDAMLVGIEANVVGYSSAQVLRNNGSGGFTVLSNVPGLIPILDSAPQTAWGDVDNDGDLDMAYCAHARSGETRILLNRDGNFSQSVTLPRFFGYVALGDYDGDAVLDYAFSGTAVSGAFTNGILRGLGRGTFGASGTVLDQSTYGPVGFCDVDGDGRLDFWQVGFYTTSRRLYLYRNLGAGQLATPVVIPVSLLDPSTIRWADCDGDGDLDFMIEINLGSPPGVAPDRALTIYRNEGGFQFTFLGDPLPDADAHPLGIGDFDSDGTVDLIAGVWQGVWTRNIRVLTNQVSQPNPPPGPPTGLASRVEGQSVWLNWRPATDFNQPGGMTYNVRVGTRPGSGNVVPAMARTNGYRLVVDFGNAGVRTNFYLTNIVGETFYWSVQAVDNCYQGGPFAPEQSFTFNLPGNQPPIIGDIADQAINEDAPVVVPFTLADDRTPVDNLRLRALPANPFFIPVANIRFGGSGTNRTLTLTPATNQIGQTTVTLEATDAVGSSATRTFTVVVSNLNDAPFISAIPTQTNLYSAEPWLVQFTVGDPETPADQLQLTGVSSNPAAVPSTKIVFSGTGSNRIASILAPSPLEGETTITISVADPDGATNSRSFLLMLRNETFRLVTTSFPPAYIASMAWGDYDNDNDLDLAVAGGLNQTVIYQNRGGGLFVKADTDLPNVDGGGPEWGDFDNDGDLDLLIHGRSLSPIILDSFIARIYRNDGSGLFQLLSTGIVGRYGPGAWGDYDSDGKLDIISTGQTETQSPGSAVFHNDGGGVFRNVATITDSISGVVPWIDANEDGNLDLLLSRFDGIFWRDALFAGNGEGQFSSVPQPWYGTLMAWADFDGDGHPDVLESTGPRQDLRVLRNLGNGSLTPWGVDIQSNWTSRNVAVGDFNNDGFPDLLSSGTEGDNQHQTQLFQSQGNGGWIRATPSVLDFRFAVASWADTDNDGDLDLLFSSLLYRNEQTHSNSPPSAPAGLQASFTSNRVFLSWQPASDAQQTNGLTYNVRIGTTPGGFDVLSPMSAPNGYRLLAKGGNAGWQMRKVMKGMQSGRRYYWSVQAVDNSYKGSAFAIESSFFLGQVPSLADVPDQTMDEDGVLGVPLVVADPDGDVNVVIVNAVATNSALVPSTNLVVSGSGTNRLLLITPAPDQNGSTRIGLTVTDEQGGLTARSFMLTVLPVNDPPRAQNRHYTLAEDTNLDFVLSADDPEGDALTYGIGTFPWYGVLSGTGSQFRYSPRRDFFGDDRCEFVVSDNHGASNVFQVTFEITPVADVPGARVSIRLLTDGTPFMSLRGEPYQFYVIETSTDLRDWTAVGTYFASGGLIEFIGAPAPAGTGRFYRARLP